LDGTEDWQAKIHHLQGSRRFSDRIADHLEFSMNHGLREKVMTREIEKLKVK